MNNKNKKTDQSEFVQTLNKFIALCGVASRRKAAELVKEGRVKVNGVITLEPGRRVSLDDVIKINNRVIRLEKKEYYLLNKPKGYITTVADDKGRKTVMQLLAGASKSRLYPVGRLDRNTTGLLLLTNDGDLAQRLSHPRHGAQKVYHVTLDRELDPKDYLAIKQGVRLEDGLVKVDEIGYVPHRKKNHMIVVLHVGKYRVVRRIFEALGYRVDQLDRTRYAGLSKRGLPLGKWRPLTSTEVKRLYNR